MDSALAGGRDIPELTIFSTKGGRAIKTPDHAYAVFEVKRGRDVADNSAEIYAEKKKYIKARTRWFFILDQEEVHKWDVMDKTEAAVYRWEALTDPEWFGVCFAEVRPAYLCRGVDMATPLVFRFSISYETRLFTFFRRPWSVDTSRADGRG